MSHIWHPYTRFSALEGLPVMNRAKGIHLYDEQGKSYIDGISSWWCVNLGHRHPKVVEAVQNQASQLSHSILGNLSHTPAVELSAALAQKMPTPDRHIMYGSDGSSSIEASLKISVQYFHNIGQGQRNRFIALTDPYHGDTLGAISVGYMESFHKPIKSLTFQTHRIPTPPRDNCQASLAVLDEILAAHGEEIAGVVMESLCQGAAGMRMYCPGFLRQVAERCEAHGVLLICDEIAMGFGRTGSFFAFEQAGIDPDIICVGKGITNGSLPLSAAIVKDRIYETFNDADRDLTFYHGHTFTGNPIGCAAALATLKVYEDEEIMKQVEAKSAFLAEEMARFIDLPNLIDLRCLGMISVLELDLPDTTMAAVRDQLRADGLLLRPLGKVLYTMLPFVTSEAEIVKVLEMIAKALKQHT